MSKKIIKLTEGDIENIVRRVIIEQDLQSRDTSYQKECSGNNEISEPIMSTTLKYKKEYGVETPDEVHFILRANFPSTGSSDTVYRNTLLQLKEQVYSELKSKSVISDYNLKLYKVNSVIGSASNYFNGPLQPTHFGGKPIDSSKLSSEPYVNLPKEGDRNWNTNKGYANRRWENMVSFINKNGKSIGFSVGEGLSSPDSSDFMITDTGGCTDEKRDITQYKNPGQYVVVDGIIKLEPKKKDQFVITGLTECARGLKIIVGFFKKDEDVEGIVMPKNTFETGRGHTCDYATFTVFCNGIPVGISNMNNGPERLKFKNPKAMVGLDQSNVRYRPPSEGNRDGIQGKGDTVYSLITVGKEQLKRIITNSKDGKVYMNIQGTDGTLLRQSSGGYHGEAPMVCAYVEDEDGSKRIVYSPQEPFKGSGDVSPNVSKPMGSFNPCETIKKI